MHEVREGKPSIKSVGSCFVPPRGPLQDSKTRMYGQAPSGLSLSLPHLPIILAHVTFETEDAAYRSNKNRQDLEIDKIKDGRPSNRQ